MTLAAVFAPILISCGTKAPSFVFTSDLTASQHANALPSRKICFIGNRLRSPYSVRAEAVRSMKFMPINPVYFFTKGYCGIFTAAYAGAVRMIAVDFPMTIGEFALLRHSRYTRICKVCRLRERHGDLYESIFWS